MSLSGGGKNRKKKIVGTVLASSPMFPLYFVLIVSHEENDNREKEKTTQRPGLSRCDNIGSDVDYGVHCSTPTRNELCRRLVILFIAPREGRQKNDRSSRRVLLWKQMVRTRRLKGHTITHCSRKR